MNSHDFLDVIESNPTLYDNYDKSVIEELLNDEEQYVMYKILIKHNPRKIYDVPLRFSISLDHGMPINKWYHDLVIMCVKQCPEIYKEFIYRYSWSASNRELRIDMIKSIIEKYGRNFDQYTGNIITSSNFSQIEKETLMKLAVKYDPCAINHVFPKELDQQFGFESVDECKKLYLDVVSRNGMSLGFIHSKMITLELCKIAIKQNPNAIIYVPQQFVDAFREKSIIYTANSRTLNNIIYIISNRKTENSSPYGFLKWKLGFLPKNESLYFKKLYITFHDNYVLPQLNLLQITANSHEISQIFDVHEIISEFI